MPQISVSTSNSPSLYLFKAEELPLEGTFDAEHKRQLTSCLRALQNSLSAVSKVQAVAHLKTATSIASKLENSITTEAASSSNLSTSWRLVDQNDHLDIQQLQVTSPLQCLAINLISAYEALLDTCNAADFTSLPMQTQKQGLHDCTHFLLDVLNLT